MKRVDLGQIQASIKIYLHPETKQNQGIILRRKDAVLLGRNVMLKDPKKGQKPGRNMMQSRSTTEKDTMPPRNPTEPARLLEHWKVKSRSKKDWWGIHKQQTETRPGVKSEQDDISRTCAEDVPNVKVRETQL